MASSQTPTRRPQTRPPKKSSRFSQAPTGRALRSFERKALKHHATLPRNRSRTREDIPYLRPLFLKGTQCPCLRLKYGHGDVTSSGGGVISTVFTINFANLEGSTDWDDVFDEFRIVRAHAEYIPIIKLPVVLTGTTVVNSGTLVAMTDYDDATALSSQDNAWSYDNSVVFNTQDRHQYPAFQPDFAPDLEWRNLQTDQATGLGYFKLYSTVVTASTTYGQIWAWADVQFRAA